MKKFITGFVIAAILFSLAPSLADTNLKDIIASPNNYPIYVNGEDVDVEAYNIDGYTYLKIANIANVFNDGTEVMFNQTKEIIEITHKRNNANIKPEKNTTVETYEKDGYNILNYHGTELISLKEIEETYKDSHDKGYWEFKLLNEKDYNYNKNPFKETIDIEDNNVELYILVTKPFVDNDFDGIKESRGLAHYRLPVYLINKIKYTELKHFGNNLIEQIENTISKN
ncbi:MAG: hypothetical protein FH761_16575 [Firmicutes bacterium]|nr:hypothetical protein [Bacillota bacterium]